MAVCGLAVVGFFVCHVLSNGDLVPDWTLLLLAGGHSSRIDGHQDVLPCQLLTPITKEKQPREKEGLTTLSCSYRLVDNGWNLSSQL